MSGPDSRPSKFWRRLAYTLAGIAVAVAVSTVYLLSTSPFASDTIVRPAFTTSVSNGQIVLTTNYTPHVVSGPWAQAIGYYKQALTIFWDRLTSPKMPAGTATGITNQIYALRFNPTRPYLISGDQFDDLYLRNLSVFYQDLLNPHTFVSATDQTNRERIALQSLAYGLSALQQLHRPVTTLSPISPHTVLAINIYDYPSDSMFSLFNLLLELKQNPATASAATMLQSRYAAGLSDSYRNYLATVQDPKTGLVKTTVRLSGARDAAQRRSSFYDNVMLWKTKQLATQLGFDHVPANSLQTLHDTIANRYWDASQGHFIDDVSPGNDHSYSSDWLIALPVGFLLPQNPADLGKLKQISSYIDANHLAEPLPIRYTSGPDPNINIFVKLFAGDYGSTATWSYWGDLYITMQTDLYAHTGQMIYARHAVEAITRWNRIIVRDRGYPETLSQNGNLYETPFYESIRRNGWVVDFAAVKYAWNNIHE